MSRPLEFSLASLPAPATSARAEEERVALTALNRFGLGARPGEASALAPRPWLLDQIGGETELPAMLRQALPDRARAGDVLEEVRQAQRAGAASGDRERLAQARRDLQQLRQAEQVAVLTQRATTSAPFSERLVAFWSNHLCVSFQGKLPVAALAGLYEREVIRPHVYGSFADMLLASARHPAMLLYLDNARSTGPGSPAARTLATRRARQAARQATAQSAVPAAVPGVNENYAREVLELHTLGVEGGYTQADVEALAAILTGWSVAGTGVGGATGAAGATGPVDQGPDFVFRAAQHEPGAQLLLGRRYDQRGERKGEAALRDLARHPATARFVAGKLATHFLADAPPEDAVRDLAESFLDSDGDLAVVAQTLVSLLPANPERGKLRSPQDWVVAALRGVVDAGPNEIQRVIPLARGLAPLLDRMRHPLWGPPSPKGFGDHLGDWADPDSLMNRAELARTLSDRLTGPGLLARRTGTRALDPASLASVVRLAPDDPMVTYLADASIPSSERVALLLGGPAFQWR